MNFERLRTAAGIYSNLAVLNAGVRPVVYDGLRGLPASLGPGEYAVLRRLALTDSVVSVVGVTEFLAVSRASARQTVSRLFEAGLIVGSAGAGDRRMRMWSLTPEGKSAAATQMPRVEPHLPLAAALQALSASQVNVIIEDLDDLISGLDDAEGRFDRGGVADVNGGDSGDLTVFQNFFDLWLKIVRVYRRIRAEQTRFFLRETNQLIDTAAYMALYRVHETPGGMAELASFLRVDQNTATRLVDRLEGQGFLRRMRNPSSRRELILSATDKGSRLLESLAPIDLDGAYLKQVSKLRRAGTALADVLDSVVSSDATSPLMDRQVFFALAKRVWERLGRNSSVQVEGSEFRLAMSQFLTGVAVVTVKDGSSPRAMTVNSLTSVSLDPPILLVCFDRRSPSLKALQRNREFGISILSRAQQDLAARFGRKETYDNPHTLEDDICEEVAGLPLLAGSLAQIVCDLEQAFEAGSHTVIFGAPREVSLRQTGKTDALGFWRSKFVQVRPA